MQEKAFISQAYYQHIGDISKLFATSWRFAYQGIVAEDYLSRLPDDHWVPFLQNGFLTGELLCLMDTGPGLRALRLYVLHVSSSSRKTGS